MEVTWVLFNLIKITTAFSTEACEEISKFIVALEIAKIVTRKITAPFEM